MARWNWRKIKTKREKEEMQQGKRGPTLLFLLFIPDKLSAMKYRKPPLLETTSGAGGM